MGPRPAGARRAGRGDVRRRRRRRPDPSRVRSAVAACPTRTGSSCRRSASTPTTRCRAAPGTYAGARADHRGRRPERGHGGYGPMKVACEQAVLARHRERDGDPARPDRRARATRAAGSPTGRCGCATGPRGARPRVARTTRSSDRRPRPGGVDRRLRGGAAHRRPRRDRPGAAVADLLDEVSEGVGGDADVHVGGPGLPDRAGRRALGRPGSLPLWLPRPEYDGMLAHDADLPQAAGLTTRPVAESARDTLAWARRHARRRADRHQARAGAGAARDLERPVVQPVSTPASSSAALSAPPRRIGRYAGFAVRAVIMAVARSGGVVAA